MKFLSEIKKALLTFTILFTIIMPAAAADTSFQYDYPAAISSSEGRFPQTVRNGSDSYVFWQEVNSSSKQIQIMVARYGSDTKKLTKPVIKRLLGTFEYSGEVPELYTAQISNSGTILVAVPSNNGLTIFTSTDKAQTFYKKVIRTDRAVIGPRAYITSTGSFRLFYSLVDDVTKEKVIDTSVASLTEEEAVEVEQIFNLYYIDSSDGIMWSGEKLLQPPKEITNPFIPFLIPFNGGDLVIFQAQQSAAGEDLGTLSHYQLYKTITYNDGRTWSKPVVMMNTKAIEQDQSPFICNYHGKLYLSWERSSGDKTSVMFSPLDGNANVEDPQNISGSGKIASKGKLFVFDNGLYITWYEPDTSKDTSLKNSKLQLRRLINNDIEFTEKVGSGNGGVDYTKGNSFPSPLILVDEEGEENLNFICQNTKNGITRISVIGPDRTVGFPTLIPVSFRAGKRSAKKDVEINIEYPDDVSGIKGYTYTWGIGNTLEPDKENARKQRPIKLSANEDGVYTLNVLISDNAGNWSDEVRSLDYYHDITPPQKPEVIQDFIDDYGFIKTSNFRLNWNKSFDENKQGEDQEASYYIYELVKLGKIPSSLGVYKNHPITMSRSRVENELNKLRDKYSKKIEKAGKVKSGYQTRGNSTIQFENPENGVYRFSISAVDEVGNISEADSFLVFINKYSPTTKLNKISQQFANGELRAVFEGSGYTYDGEISHIFIDRDGKLNANGHYDLELSHDNGDFEIKSDKKISNIMIGSALRENEEYTIIMVHTFRGKYTAPIKLKIDKKTGKLKYIPAYEYTPKYKALTQEYKYIIAINIIIAILIMLLMVLVCFGLFYIVAKTIYERRLIKEEVNSLTTGVTMPSLKTRKKIKNQKSLRGKIVAFIVILIILVVSIITAFNVRQTLQEQGKTLTSSIHNQVDLLIKSIDSGVTSYMPYVDTEGDAISSISALPDQISALKEAEDIIILGHKYENPPVTYENPDLNRMIYVWAAKESADNAKFDYSDFYGQFKNGITRIIIPSEDDSDHENYDLYKIIRRMDNLNKDVIEQVNSYSKYIALFQSNMMEALANNNEEEFNQLVSKKDSFTKEMTAKFSELENQNSGSIPDFKGVEDLSHSTYLFYRPVLYRDKVDSEGNLENTELGLIVMKVDVSNLQEQLRNSIKTIILSGVILAFISIIIGAVGSWVLASIIVRPIRQLESHIQEVGSLLTKSARERMRLQKMEIDIKSRDEIGRLGEVVNKMSSTVAKAAEDEYLNMDAKVVQERFVPLSDGEGGKKLPVIKYTEDKLNIFAFYKGDSEVSGDYFDYKQLDDRWFVFIKCDVSGHGTPAALLVSVIATKFKEFYYYSNWNFKNQGINLVEFVSAVNDFIYDLGTRGKFSTINISLYNKDTGELYTCNAGDNKLDLFEADKRRLRRITLANAPTAGGLPTDLIMTTGGFKVEKTTLRHGDTLYLYTDGIDEAERLVRAKDYSVKQERKEDKKFNPRTGKEEKTVQILDVKEQFGEERVRRIIEAVLNKRKFILDKEENPTKEILEFDFTTCKGTSEETILALASVERVFRMVKMPDVKANDEIEIDKLLDDFLKSHFALYNTYCRPAEKTEDVQKSTKKNRKDEVVSSVKVEDNPNVTRYGYVVEDKQADDITLIAIHRP